MSLIDLFKEFHSRAIVDAYPSSARALYFTLLGEFNAAYFPEERVYSERELSRLTGLSSEPVHRSLKFLADRGHIKTKATKRGTIIQLCGCQALAKHKPSTCQAPETSSIIRVREDVKDVKTKSSSSARAREKIDEAQEHWELIKGGRLTFEHLSELQVLIDKYGLEWLKARMTEASDANGNSHGLSMKFFRAFIKRYLKGGEKVETASPSYTKPARTGNEPWANY